MSFVTPENIRAVNESIQKFMQHQHQDERVFFTEYNIENLMTAIDTIYPKESIDYKFKAVLFAWIHFFQNPPKKRFTTHNQLKDLKLPDPIHRSFFVPLSQQRNDIKTVLKESDFDTQQFQNLYETMLLLHKDPTIKWRNQASRNKGILIPAPEAYRLFLKSLVPDHQETVISIDSRDRNNDADESNDYLIHLGNDIKYIYAVELIQADIPKTEYIIHANNKKIHFRENNAQVSAGTFFVATLTEGNYTISELVTEIASAFNDSDGSSFYTVTEVSATRNIKISSDLTGGDGLFNLHFLGDTEVVANNQTRDRYLTDSAGPTLGFLPENHTGTSNYTSDFFYNLNGEEFVMLYLEPLQNVHFEINDRHFGAFLKIPLDIDNSSTKFYRSKDDLDSIIYFNPPIERLGQIRVRFEKFDRTLYRFHGHPNSLTLKFYGYFGLLTKKKES